MKTCTAIQYSDQKVCKQCNLVWDTNDPEPPLCGQLEHQGEQALVVRRRALAKIRALLR